jgi:hypothetical protein
MSASGSSNRALDRRGRTSAFADYAGVAQDAPERAGQSRFDVTASGGRGSSLELRRQRVEAEAARLVSLGATRLRTVVEEGLDHYAVALADPEGNEFDIN